MESERKLEQERRDNEILYSKAIKAGKRIYYLDVKRGRNDDLYLAITESKKKVTGMGEEAQVSIEKHKIFLYKEDFKAFTEGLDEVMGYIRNEVGEITPRPAYVPYEERAERPERLERTAEQRRPDESSNESNHEEVPQERPRVGDETSGMKKGFFRKFF